VGLRPFPVRQLIDDDGELVCNVGDEERFRTARNGDHLLTTFQCERCHFQNIYRRSPVRYDGVDEEVMYMIRRANLDAFWSREPSTVGATLRGAKRMSRTESKYQMPSATPPMGPFPVEDSLGMMGAILVLDRSLDPGVYEDTVQWETFRKTMSTITNISQAGVGGLGNSVGAYERARMWISESLTHTFWFSRFMTGIHKRVGEVRKQDKLVTIDVLHKVEIILEDQWKIATKLSTKKRIAEMGAWYIGGFCTALRGEEMLIIELAGTRNSLVHLNEKIDPHFKFNILGRTKGNQMSGAEFKVPCVPITEGTGLQPGKWVQRLVLTLRDMGTTRGRLFQRALKPSKLMEFENDFYTILEKVQSSTNLIGEEVCIRDEYGILRSLRRGVTAHAKNMEVGETLVNGINRWRSEEKGAMRLDMADLYTTLEALLPTVLRYSRAL
jgi:hypothetical protein